MQTQYLSEVYPNIISISKVREDIHALLNLLEKYPEVKVLRGQRILFTAVRHQDTIQDKDRVQKAVAFFDRISKKYRSKKTKIPASEWVIADREKRRKPSYYAKHYR